MNDPRCININSVFQGVGWLDWLSFDSYRLSRLCLFVLIVAVVMIRFHNTDWDSFITIDVAYGF